MNGPTSPSEKEDFSSLEGGVLGGPEDLLKRGKGRPKQMPSILGSNFFLTIPHYQRTLDQTLELLKLHQPQWDYMRYAAVLQTHTLDPAKGAHLHLYVSFSKRLKIKVDRYSYLGQGKLQRVRNYKKVLGYLTKQNMPVSNFDFMAQILRADFSKGVYILFKQGMKMRQIYEKYSPIIGGKNWKSMLHFQVYRQDQRKIQFQLDKKGLRFITPQLIRARLSAQQYDLYHSHPCYARIVNRINDIVRYGCHRPHKTPALLVTGAPNTGKTTLGLAIAARVSTFIFPDDGWFQSYQSDVFRMILWNQFHLAAFPYPTLLKFLQGLRMNLPIKGSHVHRNDNPFIYLTSNKTVQEHVVHRFKSQDNRRLSRANLAPRIDQVNIEDRPIFFLTKLLVSPTEDICYPESLSS